MLLLLSPTPGDASSVTVSATLTRCPVLLFICFSSPLLLRAHLSTLCDLMCSPPPLYLWGKLFENKGNTAQRGGIFWNTINVILYVLKRLIFFLLPFLTVYDFFCGSCVNLYACGSFCLFLSILYVCVCYKRDYFQFTYLITQQKDRSSVRDSVSSVCTLYDSVCLLFFYLICQVRPFSFSLRLSISVITLKSCTVPFEQEWVTTKL